MITVIAVSGFSAFLIVWAVLRMLGPGGSVRREEEIKKRVFTSSPGPSAIPESVEKKRYFSDVPLLSSILSRYTLSQKIAFLLKRARWKISVSVFLFTSGLLCLTLFGALRPRFPLGTSLALSFAGSLLPYLILNLFSRRYLLAFSEHLADALSMISSGIKAGHGLETAAGGVASAAPYPVNEEFDTVVAETKLGSPLPTALKHLHERLGLSEVKILAMGISIHEELGGNLSELLDNLEETIRDRFALAREIRSLSAQGRYSLLVISAIPFFVFGAWYISDRALLLEFFYSTIGQRVLWGAGLTYALGGLWAHRITRLES